MPHGVIDRKELTSLIEALRAILANLEGWERDGAAKAPQIDIGRISTAFQGIARALERSGNDGQGLREALPLIAEALRASAEALDQKHRR